MSGGRGRGMTLPAWMTTTNTMSSTNSEAEVAGRAVSLPVHIAAAPLVAPAVFPLLPPKQLATALKPEVSNAVDPNNDASLWTMHVTPDGRKYWFNAVSSVSTYDKPFCLKTPEERAIPPCAWKEYFSDGKVYYSNGKESSWTMPEEFRIWKEKMDELENKKKNNPAISSSVVPSDQSHVPSKGNAMAVDVNGSGKASAEPSQYATLDEAMEAFKDMLAAYNISVSAKMKEVSDLCHKDARWDALKSQGEKRQALAEYQTKRLKLEKDQQKLKARKLRDSFLVMLAENTSIDARTDWRHAVEILKDDNRFKSIEDAREREDLFRDFILELQKKEREDVERMRSNALTALDAELLQRKNAGEIDRKSTWNDQRDQLLKLLMKNEFKVLNEQDVRRTFQKLVDALAEEHNKAERSRRESFLEKSKALLLDVKSFFQSLAQSGSLNHLSRFRDDNIQQPLQACEPYGLLLAMYREFYGETGKSPEQDVRDMFESVITSVQDDFRVDRRAVKHLLADHNMRIGVESRLEDFINWLEKVSSADYRKRHVKEEGEEDDEHVATAAAPSRRSLDRNDPKGSDEATVRKLLQHRHSSIQFIFKELQERAIQEREEEIRHQRKCEERFVHLLQEHFYRSDHLGTTWEEAKPILQRRSAYDALPRADRKRVFQSYMDDMAEKMRSKERSLKALKEQEGARSPDRNTNDHHSSGESPSRKRGRTDND